MVRVVLVGGRGLIARAIWSLLSQDPRVNLHVLGRMRPPGLPSFVTFIPIDLTEGPDRLARAVDGATVVVNASSYVGGDLGMQHVVNVEGVRSIVAAAERAGSVPLIHISTAGVYGTLRRPGGAEGTYRVAPASALSTSRAEGDAIAEAYGASILRPLYVTGDRDRHFLLPLLQAHVALGAWIDRGAARISVVHASFVAAAVRFVLDQVETGTAIPLAHVVTPGTVTVRELLTPVFDAAGWSPSRSIGTEEAVRRATHLGVPPRKVAQFAADSFLTSQVLPRALVDTGMTTTLLNHEIEWYASQLQAA